MKMIAEHEAIHKSSRRVKFKCERGVSTREMFDGRSEGKRLN